MQRNLSTQDINDSLLNGVKIEMVSAYTMEWIDDSFGISSRNCLASQSRSHTALNYAPNSSP